ncbi:hypothetical protein [Cellulophaga sp. Z1A5H]|uniref:hypothetical protein n=1 Tax=Cellulophaga sp. Z1A5H TaxID=2687291 RepID=UPI0013FDB52E|nr:hypothetical protein [Cellulophaga sp. Z1A5H]
MKLRNFLISTLAIFLLLSCTSKKKEQKSSEENTVEVHPLVFPGGSDTSLPHLFSNNNQTILSWVKSINDSVAQLNYCYLKDGNWEQPIEIITGKDWFVNWADYPTITENNGNLLAHYLEKSSKETFAYDVKLNVLPKEASKWQTQKVLHTDGTKTEHGFVTALPYQDDSFFITWLDGRNTGSDAVDAHAGHGGAMAIRAAEVSSKGTVSEEVLLDPKTCSCCQTTAAITDNGPIVLYRDRTDEEIRDIAITRRVDGKWTTPKFIHKDGWEINGCPVNGPKVDAIENNIVVAWFTAVNNEPKVQLIFSENGGEDFLAPMLISTKETLGRVDVEMLNADTAIVSWMETIAKKTYLKAMKVTKDGIKSTPISISVMGDSRDTGFPQMERVGDKMYFAWTVHDAKISSIKTAYVGLDLF